MKVETHSIHAKWLVDFYNHMTTLEGEQVISNGWSDEGITNALKNEETCLEPLESFADIDPLVSEPSVEQDDIVCSKLTKVLFKHLSSEEEKDSCDSESESEYENVFDVIAQELRFVIFIDFLQSYFQNTLH